jgi:anti-anti-sigma regulatory factor
VLVGVQKRLLQRGGALELQGLRSGPRRVFAITGLDQVFTLHD